MHFQVRNDNSIYKVNINVIHLYKTRKPRYKATVEKLQSIKKYNRKLRYEMMPDCYGNRMK